MGFDVGCYDLAASFLSDEPGATEADIDRLAQEIQDTIESFIGYDRELRARRPKT